MAMIQAFYTGVSGLKNFQNALDVNSNNLANIDTVGFRGYRSEFQELFAHEIAQKSAVVDNTIAYGTSISTIQMDTSGGTLINSDRNTDLAISGNGWFGTLDGNGEPLYSRSGNFTFDSNRDLVTTNEGFHVLGTLADNVVDGVLTTPLNDVPLGDINAQEPLNFPLEITYPVTPTDQASFLGNLGIDNIVRSVSATAISPNNEKNAVVLEFRQSTTQPPSGINWDITATVSSPDGSTLFDTQTGLVQFDGSGALIAATLPPLNNDGAEVSIDLGSGFSGLISNDSAASSLSSSSNGLAGGELSGYSINQNAEVIATFSNGQQSAIGKIALYHFQNEQGLERINATNYRESSNSGEALFWQDADGNNILGATVFNFKLENSNVDSARGLSELIILQRSFDANAKSVTTSDQMLQKALDMDA